MAGMECGGMKARGGRENSTLGSSTALGLAIE